MGLACENLEPLFLHDSYLRRAGTGRVTGHTWNAVIVWMRDSLRDLCGTGDRGGLVGNGGGI